MTRLSAALALAALACAEVADPSERQQDTFDTGVMDDIESCPPAPLPRRLRRLSHREYRHAMADLFDVDVAMYGSLAADPTVDGFDNDAEALRVGALLADQYRSLAEAVALSADLSPWRDCSLEDPDCLDATISALARSVWRRPLNAEEHDELTTLAVELTLGGTREHGLRWMLAALLQSPHFLYRSEVGIEDSDGIYILDDWEKATALSFQIWGTTPDEALLDAAATGRLRTDDGLAQELERMLEDPRVDAHLTDLVEAWLHLGQLDTVSRIDLTQEARADLRAGIRERVQAMTDGTPSDLLRAGLLVDPALLTTHGVPEGSGPVQRGVMVRELLLCEPLPPPPSGIDTSAPEVDPSQTTRQQVDQHASDPACAACHEHIDPLGFAFEHYDQLGHWRDHDHGLPIDDSGHLDGTPFEGAQGLALLLASDPRLGTCYLQTARRWLRGRPTCTETTPELPLQAPLRELDWSRQ